MNLQNWRDAFYHLTAGGFLWRSSASYGSQIAGEVWRNGQWVSIGWGIGPGGTLTDPNDGANDIEKKAGYGLEITMPSRSLNVPFVAHALRDVLGLYTVEFFTSLTVSGSDSAGVQLLIDGQATAPEVSEIMAMTLGLGISLDHTSRDELIGVIPAGSAATLSTSGTTIPMLIRAVEVLL